MTKPFTDGLYFTPTLIRQVEPPPTPDSGEFRVYFDPTGTLRWVDDAGNIASLLAGLSAARAGQLLMADGADGTRVGPALTVSHIEPSDPADGDVWMDVARRATYTRQNGVWVFAQNEET